MIIRFKFAAEKAAKALNWVIAEQPGIDLHAAMKTFYFADVTHLNEHYRPIFGATYRAMRFGPVPLEMYEMAKGDPLWLAEAGVESFPWRLEGYRLHSTNRMNSQAADDLAQLPQSNQTHLQAALIRASGMTFDSRTAATHGPDWQKANLGIMDYADMVEEGPNKDNIIADLRENARHLRL